MDHRIKRALELIDRGYTREIRLKALAAELNISYSRFRHVFKSEMGVPPAQYLKNVRMEKARHLLKNTCLTIKQVTAEIGINDISHFARDFKKEHGLTPSEYRDRFNSERIAPDGVTVPTDQIDH